MCYQTPSDREFIIWSLSQTILISINLHMTTLTRVLLNLSSRNWWGLWIHGDLGLSNNLIWTCYYYHFVTHNWVVGDVLRWLAANSTTRLHIIAQYWQLLPSPDDPRSGDYGYTQHQMHEFGADQGVALYEALDAAADRNVSIRCASWLTTCMISGY